MQFVNEHNLNKNEWTLIADGMKQVALQFDQQGACRVHVAEEAPSGENALDAPGILVSSNQAGVPTTFGLGNLPATAKVWAKATGTFDETTVTVLAY